MKVLISTGVCGLQVHPEMMRQLFERDRTFFDPMPRSEWNNADGSAPSTEELEQLFGDRAIITEFVIHFFKNTSAAVRTDPWLIAQAEQDIARLAAPGHESGVKIVEVPDDVKWYLRSDSDGSESIHEEHRIWR